MHRVTYVALTTCAIVGLFLALSLPALADGWGNVHCGEGGNPSCDLGAGRSGHSDAVPPPAPHSGGPESQSGSPDAAPLPPGDRIVGGDDSADCSYVRSDFQPPANGVQTVRYRSPSSGSGGVQFVSLARFRPQQEVRAQAPAQGGAWYVYQCSGSGSRDALYHAPVWIADGEAPGSAPLPSPEELAQRSRSQLRLPSPALASNPAGTQLVRLPTWLWLERQMWQPQSATASVPGMSVAATATPASVTWSMGDGATVTCTGPGTPFPVGGDPQAASPDCGHVYQRSSATVPGERFPAKATVSWRIRWSGAGDAGTFPNMRTSASASFRVAEAQALGTK